MASSNTLKKRLKNSLVNTTMMVSTYYMKVDSMIPKVSILTKMDLTQQADTTTKQAFTSMVKHRELQVGMRTIEMIV